MSKFYFIILLLLCMLRAAAQDCSSLQFTCSATESRCVATGSITVNVSGGSGNYNFKATGPVNTPATSSNTITGLPSGNYTITVKDLTTGCTKTQANVFVSGSYSDPRFQLQKTDAGCGGNDGTIFTANQQNGRAPFMYTIVAPSPALVGATSATGNFTGLVPGEYAVQLKDSCGGVQVRRITIENYSWWIDFSSVTKTSCSNADVVIQLKDNKGNVNTSGTAFNGFLYAAVITPGDTIWHNINNFSVLLGNSTYATLLVKDNCGGMQSVSWSQPASQLPAINNPVLSNYTCSTFDAGFTSNNIVSPEYKLYNSSDALTSSNTTGVFTGLAYGSYCVKVLDDCSGNIVTKCFTVEKPIPNVDANIAISDKSCTTFTATVTGQVNLTNPTFVLSLSKPPFTTVDYNSTGVFTGVLYGDYRILIYDECYPDPISRSFTVTPPPPPVITGVSTSDVDCSTFNVTVSGNNLIDPQYCIYDKDSNVVACNNTGIFTGINYGSYCIKATSCGVTSASYCITKNHPQPSVAANVNISNKLCSGFTATVTGQVNLTNPVYELYDNNGMFISTNSTGVFTNLPYGTHTIQIKDGCIDTTLIRTFTVNQNIPSISTTVQQSNSTCSGFTARVTGTNLTAPEYSVYDDQNTLVSTNSTGIFNNLNYGTYCFEIKDGCKDSIMRVCETFTAPKGLTVSANKVCVLDSSNIKIQFASSATPYSIQIIHPNGTLLHDTLTNSNPFNILMSKLPAGTQYKIIGTDGCGQKDSALITPDATTITRNVVIKTKCPSSVWQNGSGDLQVTAASNYYATTPSIIKKDGVVFNRSFSSQSGGVYTFADLEPATYIIRYTMQTCNIQVYDTATVHPYTFPTQAQSALYQCDNNTLSLGANVNGGVGPFSYEIIGSMPESPSIVTPVQSSPVFSINTGTVYSLVRLRAIDACGNGTLDDASVLPLQNVSIAASSTCFYQNITLSVDTIANASYEWYRKTTSTDSVLVGSGTSYNLPFFVPEQIGEYICKVNVNSGCLQRISRFTLDGQCGDGVLSVPLQLTGKTVNGVNQLSWSALDQQQVSAYQVQRKADQETDFKTIGTVPASTVAGGMHLFNDEQPGAFSNQYRLQIIYKNKAVSYSNVVTISGKNTVEVFPNPVAHALCVKLISEKRTRYMLELFDFSGRKIFTQQLSVLGATTFVYNRPASVLKGMYLLKIRNLSTGGAEAHRILMK